MKIKYIYKILQWLHGFVSFDINLTLKWKYHQILLLVCWTPTSFGVYNCYFLIYNYVIKFLLTLIILHNIYIISIQLYYTTIQIYPNHDINIRDSCKIDPKKDLYFIFYIIFLRKKDSFSNKLYLKIF